MSSSYGQTYISLLENLNKKYLPYHNLAMLGSLRRKIICYEKYKTAADEYYSCFEQEQANIMKVSQQFKQNYQRLDDQYKVKMQNCKDSYIQEKQVNDCRRNSAQNFHKAIQKVYAQFYLDRAAKEPEYRRIKV